VDGKIEFKADSDAIIVKGIVALLVKVLNNRTPAEILENELSFIDDIGLRQNLSPTRSNGLLAMVKKMRLYAMAYQAKANAESGASATITGSGASAKEKPHKNNDHE